jgi:cyanophycin synthetase
MKVIETRFLRGPNLYSFKPCFKAVVDLEELDDVPSTALPGFVDALCALIPSLHEHRCSPGHYGGFVERLQEGTYMAHVIEHITIELQCLAGTEVGFGKARQVRGMPRCYTVICAYAVEPLVEEALHGAIELVTALARGEQFDIDPLLRYLRRIANRHALGPSTRAIVEAAQARNIPCERLTDDASLFQLGTGVHQRRIQATITDGTNHIAVGIASHKHMTKSLLQAAAIPVPRGYTVRSLEEALKVAAKLSSPFTVKPLDANQGKGVTTRATMDQLPYAYEAASEYSSSVIIEDYIQGDDYRVLVVDGRVVAAARRQPPTVEGDGVATIRELVERENANPSRGDGHESALTKIRLDEQASRVLAAQGYTFDDVLVPGAKAVLRGNANLSTGGTAEDVTALIHPLTSNACARAALTIGLDVAGIDLLCKDITMPLGPQGGAIIEVNAAPGIRMHEHPSSGPSRAAGAAIVESLFRDRQSRIPVIAVTGTNGKTTTTLAIEHAIRRSGVSTGLATTEGIFINGKEIMRGDCSGYWSARTVLRAPEVEVAVLEVARGGILKRGLGFDECDIAVVLNVEADHLGQDGIDDVRELARVKAVVPDAASKAVVLNADDAHCVRMAKGLRTGVEVVFFSMTSNNALIDAHIAAGGRAVYLRGSDIVLAAPGMNNAIADCRAFPFTLDGAARHNIANALAAVGALVCAGHSAAFISEGLRTFRSDAEHNPLRLNLAMLNGVQVLVDYAHNPSAYKAVAETGRALTRGRMIGVITAPGDRRDQELADVGRICADRFDELIIYEMDDLRGRPAGVTAAVIESGIQSSKYRRRRVLDVRRALAEAASSCSPDDLIVFGCASHLEDVALASNLLEYQAESANALRPQLEYVYAPPRPAAQREAQIGT